MEVKRSKTLVFVGLLFLFTMISHIRFSNSNNIVKEIVILSSSFNLRYLFLLPFTTALWKKIGVEPVVILIGEKNVFESHLQAKETIKFLKEINISIYYFQPKKLSSTSLSQIIRLFGAVLNLPEYSISDKTIFITSDADLAVFNVSNHVPNLKSRKTIHLYNTECCEPVSVPPMRGSYLVKMYPMGTIGATKAIWKQIMGFENKNYNVDEIEEYVLREFGNQFFNPSDDSDPKLLGSPIWYADQSLFSYKFDEWIKKTRTQKTISEFTSAPRRIDRINWPTANNFSQLLLKDFDDAHLPVSAYSEKEWEMFYLFIRFAYNNNLIRRLENYRKNFCQSSLC